MRNEHAKPIIESICVINWDSPEWEKPSTRRARTVAEPKSPAKVTTTSGKFLTYAALVERGIFNNRMTLKRAMDKQGFPRPYKLGERRVGWDAGEVEAWLASRRA